jgi:hypothetical protein
MILKALYPNEMYSRSKEFNLSTKLETSTATKVERASRSIYVTTRFLGISLEVW